jgi:hypothetical protein
MKEAPPAAASQLQPQQQAQRSKYVQGMVTSVLTTSLYPFVVEREAAHIGRKDSQMDPIRAGWKRVNGGYFSIQQGLPTRR